ncbi:phenylacetate--CoA ligase family protein [Candidatus Sumerlaeota bacterium]|nr:phenylacetate--CoA ligase family protein [Candidatus Sumerlaeota bacterium]
MTPLTATKQQRIGPWVVRHVMYPHVFGLLRKVSGKSIMAHVARFEEQSRWPPERRAEHTLTRIRELFQHAWDHVPIWREKLTSIGAEPGDIRTWEDFARVPRLKRDEVRNRLDDCLADNVPEDQRILCRSSGSSGERLCFWADRARDPLHHATVHLNHRWVGIEVGEREAMLWADVGLPFGRRSWHKRLPLRLLNRMFFSTQRLDEEMLNLFHRRVSRFRPRLLTVFPTLLAVYIRHCHERGLRPPRPRAIISTGEMLSAANRSLFEEALGAPVFDRFGSVELGDIAHECEAHEGMHINAHRVWVEVLPIEGLDESMGALAVTDLDNRALPLIRYETGDLGRLWPSETTHRCPCGRTLPRLEAMMGRFIEVVRGPSGRHWPQLCFTILPHLRVPGILNMQIVHRPPRTIICRCQTEQGFPGDGPARIAEVIHENTDREFDVSVELTDDLIRTPTGKLRRLIIEGD